MEFLKYNDRILGIVEPRNNCAESEPYFVDHCPIMPGSDPSLLQSKRPMLILSLKGRMAQGIFVYLESECRGVQIPLIFPWSQV